MSSTPRKSSVASRRVPASLRLPTLARQASNPHISLVFASGDSSLAPHPDPTRGSSSYRSEEALSRQLDSDTGGRHIGLRSRRSSSGTVRTVRTMSGVGGVNGVSGGPGGKEPSPTRSVAEEDEEGMEPVAGPSSQPARADDLDGLAKSAGLDSAEVTARDRALNPKVSSSWLRWNSPAPSFPRSGNKGKGKAKEEDPAPATLAPPRPDTPAGLARLDPSALQPAPKAEDEFIPTSPPAPIPPAEQLDEPPDPPLSPLTCIPPPAPAVASGPAPATSSAKRSWWTRTASPASTIRAKDDLPPGPLSSTDEEPRKGDEPLAEQAANDDTNRRVAIASAAVPPLLDIKTAADTSQTSTVQPKEQEAKSQDEALKPTYEAGRVSAWRGYLAWGAATSIPPTLPPGVPFSLPAGPSALVLSAESASDSVVKSSMDATVAEHPEAAVVPLAAATVQSPTSSLPNSPTQPQTGWGGYLYSFVVPSSPAPTATRSTTATPILPSSPTVDQPPAPSKPPPVVRVESDPLTSLQPPPTASLETNSPANNPSPPRGRAAASDGATASSSRTASHLRKGSVTATSSTGWLTYLAMRAGQRKLTAGSVASEGDGRKSTDTNGVGEVMDFSADPDFPQANGLTAEAEPIKDAKPALMAPKAVANKSSALSVRKKRLSMSSTKSGGSLAPMGTSPKQPPPDNKPTPKSTSDSALPPPPQPPAAQPNLVIPTFSTSFDRPPRSLLPLQPEAEGPTVKGLTAATTGLAWRAIAAAGSYVYSGTAEKPGPESLMEDEKEMRGRKEGRAVGSGLPRRTGLGHGSPDDGWKNVRRVVVVGVHGWFPAKMLNSVIGEPTGTSAKFANMMGAAVKKFFDDMGVADLRLTLLPLQGEGTIEHRVDKLYKAYLSNPAWINDLRRSDAIFFAAHSQGCIVTTHLISRLIAQGHIRTPFNREAVGRCEWAFGPVGLLPPEEPRRGRRPVAPIAGAEGEYQKVCMLAMCGVHLGPLVSISTSNVIQPYLQWFENAAARELFEFQDSGSAVSQAYQKALAMGLENGVRVVLLSSLNDQVVPIYGSSFSTASHPLLLRALFVDGASYSASDFMTNLLCFAFMLRNAGIDDQRLVEHLSEAVAGSLTGVGHSSPYEEPACYTLAVEYLFHATPARQPMPPLTVEPFSARDARNDYELPWIMRALVDDPAVKDLFPSELRELKEGVVGWRPGTKALREIKRRLEPMAGRQSRLRPLGNNPSSTSLSSAANGDAPGVRLGGAGKAKEGPASLRKDW